MIHHVVGLFTHPDEEWKEIRGEEESIGHMYLTHVLLLAAIPAVSAYIGTTQIGWTIGTPDDLIAKIERLEEEKKEVAEQIKEIYAEAKAFGFDTKALRQVIKLRKVDRAEREEQEMVLDTYLLALGEA